ncbi:MAG: hypothetical protein ACTSYR_04155 [Candidatus Odinarchaeia archaeon]
MAIFKNNTNSMLIIGNKRFKPYEEKEISEIDSDIKYAVKGNFLVLVGGGEEAIPNINEVEVKEKTPEEYFEKHWKTLEKEIKDIEDIEFLQKLLDYAVDINTKTTRNMGGYISVLKRRIQLLSKEE